MTNVPQPDMKETQSFLESFMVENGLMQICVGTLDSPVFFDSVPLFKPDAQNRNIFFSPAPRRVRGSEKKHVAGTNYLWIDVDDPVLPDPTFPASAIVWSGHGWHLYWKLREPITDIGKIEALNQIVIDDVPTADVGCWNANRLMRMPNTMNAGDPGKDEEPVMCTIHTRKQINYDADDFNALAGLSNDIRYLIRSGDKGTYHSRSERDWAVMVALVNAGATDQLVEQIFRTTQVGNKYREHGTPDHYLQIALTKIREEYTSKPATVGEKSDSKAPKERRSAKAAERTGMKLIEREDGYWAVGTTQRRISTFILDPQYMLRSVDEGAQDALVCNVVADGITTLNVTFPKNAFTTVAAMDKVLSAATWQWIGGEAPLRELLPFLHERLKEKNGGTARIIAASSIMGLHNLDQEVPMFVGDTHTATPNAVYPSDVADIAWLPTNRSHPTLDLTVNAEEDYTLLRELILEINSPTTIWTMLGWYSAAIFKPWLEKNQTRMPILNITGTKGSGKTTLSQRVMMPLFGQPNATGYDAGTTKFVRLALLGSSNAVPIAFSEFRQDTVAQFIRTILMAYDTGHDARGRGDQTTVEYPLCAPFSVDGEDVIDDSAARERIVVARMRPDTVAEGTDAYIAFQRLRSNLPKNFAGHFIQRALEMIVDGTAAQLLADAKAEFFAAFPSRLPDRVRNNYTVVFFGAKVFAKVLGIQEPEPEVFEESMKEIVSLESGRSKTLIDDFVESVALAVKQNPSSGFQWRYEHNTVHGGVLYVQLTSAHGWWLQQRRRQNRSVMERDSLKAQLAESKYYADRKVLDSMWMYGINLKHANEMGLDIPTELSDKFIRLPI